MSKVTVRVDHVSRVKKYGETRLYSVVEEASIARHFNVLCNPVSELEMGTVAVECNNHGVAKDTAKAHTSPFPYDFKAALTKALRDAYGEDVEVTFK